MVSNIDTFFLGDTITIVSDTLKSQREIFEQIQMNSSSDSFEFVAVISGVVAALAALASIILTYRNNKLERMSRRAYFNVESPGFKQINNHNDFRLQITFRNSGIHAASKFKGIIRMIPENLGDEVKIDINIANDIPKDSPTPYYNDGIQLGNNMPKHFIYCYISYLDPILRKEYYQEFFMKWNGVENGTTHPDFVQVDESEKKIILDYLKNNA